MTTQAEADRAAFEAALEAGLAAYNGVPDSHSQNVANVVHAAITAYQASLRALSPAAAMEDSAMVEAIRRALEEYCRNPTMLKCERCNGTGYHHGFGETGCDPDWCEVCGGNQFIEDENGPARAALAVIQGQGGLRPFVRRDDTVERVAAEEALREIHKLAVHRGTFASVDTRMEHAEHALSRIATLSTPTGKYAIVKGE